MEHILVDRQLADVCKGLQAYAHVETFDGLDLRLAAHLPSSASSLFVRSITPVNKSLLQGSGIRSVFSATSGIDHIDLEYCQSQGISVVSCPGANANAVTEWVFYGIVLWSIRYGRGPEGMVLGIVGLGHVGRRLAQHARHFGIRVLYNDPPLCESEEYRLLSIDIGCERGLDDLVRESDLITNHVPLTEKGMHPTLSLFKPHHLKAMKSDSLFLHASRGGIVGEFDLIDACHSMVCTDVWENEPHVRSASVLRSFLATPHIAGYSSTARTNASRALIRAFLRTNGYESSQRMESYPAWHSLAGLLEEQRGFMQMSAIMKRHGMDGPMIEIEALRRRYSLASEMLPDPGADLLTTLQLLK